MKLYSCVVEHDTGHAPNPYFGACTLCRCKFRECRGKPKNVVELAEKGDWIAGTGGADQRKSAGHGKLVYVMRVDEKITRQECYACPRFRKKMPRTGTYKHQRGDNEPPKNDFEKRDQFVLISRHFYYFGSGAINIPKEAFPNLEKRGPGFRCDFDPAYIDRFVEWLGKQTKPGKHGEPCQKVLDQPKGSKKSKSSC